MEDEKKLDYLINVLKLTPKLVNNIIKNNQTLNKKLGWLFKQHLIWKIVIEKDMDLVSSFTTSTKQSCHERKN